jgi:hypothetical protein
MTPTRLALLMLLGVVGLAQAQEPSIYTITLGDQNIALGRCAVNVALEGGGEAEIVAHAPTYAITFSVPPEMDGNRAVRVKGKIKWSITGNNAPACNVDGQVYLNQLIIDEWQGVKERLKATDGYRCIVLGATKLGEAIDGAPAASRLYLRPGDPKVRRVAQACDRLIGAPLQKNVSCELGNGGGKSFCDEGFYSQQDGRLLSFESALYELLDGRELKREFRETPSAMATRQERQRKEAEERAAQEAARQKLAKEEADRQAWLKTPEGRQWLAAEAAKRKREEDERLRAADAERKRLAMEFPFYALISCGIGSGHMTITACFSGDFGSLEVRNGEDYGLYKIFHIIGGQVPHSRETQDGFAINLRERFEISARNGEQRNVIMGLKIVHRASGKAVYERQTDRFGILKVRN